MANHPKGGKNPELHKQKLLEALEKHFGIVTAACREIGISRNTFYDYYKKDDNFKRAVDDINEITLDFAESQLLKKIKEGSEKSIMFFMKYKARKRGYTESIDINGNLGLDINLKNLFGFKGDKDDE